MGTIRTGQAFYQGCWGGVRGSAQTALPRKFEVKNGTVQALLITDLDLLAGSC